MEKELLSWDAPEHSRLVRTTDWYWGLALSGLAGVVLSVYLGNYSFGGVILLSTILLIMIATKPIHIHKIILNETSMIIDGKKISYENIVAFWFFDHHIGGPRLLLKSNTLALPVSAILLNNQVTMQQIRTVFEGKITESEIKIPIIVQVFEEIF